MTRWSELRTSAAARLRAASVDDPEQEVRWIVERASGRTPTEQATTLDLAATDREQRHVEQMISRRVSGEPLQYVLGSWSFRTLDLLVDERVLIPRPETEVVAGLAIALLPRLDRVALVADLGTGSGAIALAIAAERWPHVEVWATDASPDALAVARANLAGLGRRAAAVRLAHGDWFSALPDDLRGRLDVVVSNPPYVATTDALPEEVARWEPTSALLAGPDGLADLRRIIAEAPTWLVEDGVLVLEIGETQGAIACDLATDAGFARVIVESDLAGRDRVLVAHVVPPEAP